MSRANRQAEITKKTRALLAPGAKVVVWARVSSREQREQGWSVPQQLREVREFVKAQGWVVAHEFGIDESATRHERARFLEMLGLVDPDPTIAGIVSLRLDRLQRANPLDRYKLEALRQHSGLKIRFVKETFDETAFGQFVYGLRQEIAGLEIGILKERIQEGFLGRAEEGWYPHKPLYPYVTGNKTKGEAPIRLDPMRPERAILVRRFFELVATGAHTPEDARNMLVREGHIYSTSSKRIPRPKAYEMLRNRFFLGEFVFQGVTYAGKHEPIITPELWQQVQDVLDGRGRRHGKGTIPYNGLVVCGLCGASMTCEGIKKKVKGGGTKVYGYLRCSMSGEGHGKRGCKVPRLTVVEVERHLGELVESISFADDALEKVRGKLRESHHDHVERVQKALDSHRRQLVQAEEKKKRAFKLALEGGIEADLLKETVAGVDAEVVRVRGEVARLEGESRTYYEEGVRVIELAQRLHSIWLTQDSAQKREIVDCLLLNCSWDGVTLTPEWRRPFNLLAERPSLVGYRGDRI